MVQNGAAILQMRDDTLKKIAQELVRAVQASATIDWSLKASVRAAMRSKVRRLLAGAPTELTALLLFVPRRKDVFKEVLCCYK